MSDLADKSHPTDLYVGERLRERRKTLGLSQSALGERVDLSLQQIQKYEQGSNRIAASKLFEFSQVLGVPITYFYDGLSPEDAGIEAGDTICVERKKPLAVLLVEDSPADEVLTRRALEECDEKTLIHSVHDGATALQFLRNKKNTNNFPRPDIVLLDLNVPKVDGMSVLKDIKRDRELQDIPVVVLTNTINRQEMEACYKAGASGFVSKSFNVDEFQDNIAALVHYWACAVVLPSMQ